MSCVVVLLSVDIFSHNILFFFLPLRSEVGTEIKYERSPRGNPILVLHYNRYVKNRESKKRIFWRCTKYYQSHINCPGSVAITKPDEKGNCIITTTRGHNELCERKRVLDEQRALNRALYDPITSKESTAN